MGLESALVDRARIIRLEPAVGGRIAGSTRMVPVETDWFDAMLQLPSAPSSYEPGNGRRRGVTQPTLLFDVENYSGQPVELHAGDKIEVESDRFGLATWETTGEAEPLANLYEIIGFQVQVRRVVDKPFRPVGEPAASGIP